MGFIRSMVKKVAIVATMMVVKRVATRALRKVTKKTVKPPLSTVE